MSNEVTATDLEFPEAIRPSKGDVVAGEVVNLKMYRGGDYGAYPILELKTSEGVGALHAFDVALRNQLAELDVQVGDEIACLFLGEVTKKNGTGTYKGWRVKRLGDEAKAFTWTQVADESPVERFDADGVRDSATRGEPAERASDSPPAGGDEEADLPF